MELQQNEDIVNPVVECKRIIFNRSLRSALISLVSQVELVLLFAVFVNMNVTEPISSIWRIKQFFTYFGTWFSLILLLIVTVGYIVLLEKNCVRPKVYYRTRAHWLIVAILPKSILFILHVVLGYLTIFHLSSYLHQDYQNFTFKCFDTQCLNNYYVYLLFSSIFASCYYFFMENAGDEPVIEIPTIQERKWVQMRSLLTFNVKRFIKIAIVPHILFIIVYLIFGCIIRKTLADLLRVGIYGATFSNIHLVTNIPLQCCTFLVILTILGNMHLIKKFSSILLTEDIDFVIDSSRSRNEYKGIALADALNISELPIIQTLAAWNLYSLCSSKNSSKRKGIFTLSLPGGHPYAWNTLSEVSLKIIRNYTNDLIEAIEKSKSFQKNWYQSETLPLDDLREQKISLRNFNRSRGTRLLSADINIDRSFTLPPNVETLKQPSAELMEGNKKTFNEEMKSGILLEGSKKKFNEEMTKQWNNFIGRIPGLNYLFAEKEYSKINFILANSQTVIWLVQGLTGICAVSIIEDTYGVVQNTLPDIITEVLKLKSELEKLDNLNLNGIIIDSHYQLLHQAVKRSLYKICVTFGDYINDIVRNPNEIKQLQNFLNFEVF